MGWHYKATTVLNWNYQSWPLEQFEAIPYTPSTMRSNRVLNVT